MGWVSIQSSAIPSLQDIRDAGELFDVTLVCEDGKQLEAHKVILSASSSIFRQMLTKNSHPHPLVFLPEQSSKTLQELIDFLYKGEVEVLEEEVTEFLKLARKLQVKGLEEEGTESDSNIIQNFSREKAHTNTHVYSRVEIIKDPVIKIENVALNEENRFNKTEKDQSRKTQKAMETTETNNLETQTSLPSQPTTGVLEFTCHYCQITFKSYHLMKAHMCTENMNTKTDRKKKYIEKKSVPAETEDELNKEEMLSNEELSTELVKIPIEEVRRELEENFAEVNGGKENVEKKVETIKDILNSLVQSKDGLKQCTVCGKITNNWGHAREHAEIHIEGLRYPCRDCGKEDQDPSGWLSSFQSPPGQDTADQHRAQDRYLRQCVQKAYWQGGHIRVPRGLLVNVRLLYVGLNKTT